MKITLLVIGKTDKAFIKEGLNEYLKRIKYYIPFEISVILDIKKTRKGTIEDQKKREGELILKRIDNKNEVILLDEKGEMFSSRGFSLFLEKKMVTSAKELIFVIGGPYGFSEEVYKKANKLLSFSKMTFSHQLFRMIFVEQLYRALTIIKGEPYHHD